MTAYDKDGVRMLLNFASDCPAGRPDVLVMVVSLLNTAPLPVHNVQLQAAVPKVEKLHLWWKKIHSALLNRSKASLFNIPPVNEGEAAASISDRTGTV